MVCKVHKYADGGKVVQDHTAMKPHVPAKVKDPIKRGSPGGRHTPGERAKRGERGGPIVREKKADGGKVAKKGNKKAKPKPEHLGSGMAAAAGRAVRDTRKKQMEDLGL